MSRYLFALLAAYPSFARATCATELARALRTNFVDAREVTVHADMGLPEHNAAAPVRPIDPELARALEMTPAHILVETDLGLSVWTPVEHENWQRLGAIIADQDAALAELNKLISNPHHCTRGVLPYLCLQMRLSRAAYLRARTEYPTPPGASRNQLRAVSVQRARAVQDMHQRDDIVPFAWGHRVGAEGQMHAAHAHRTFQVLARETLLRHFVVGGEADVTLGRDLPVRDRLVFATFPYLYPLLPFAIRYPFATDETFIVGDVGEQATLLKIPVRSSGGVVAKIHVSLESGRTLERGVVPRLEFAEFDPHKAEFALARAELGVRLQRLANEFSAIVGLKSPFEVRVATHPSGDFGFALKKVSKLDQILFFYFVADQISGANRAF